ncbi:S9 family peptidase [Aquihabitans sp. G128]|uniref:S9 family peptidase n=1 Tax=Aquihabitans sp. G128 TaxID=2849779 RepID=UPI001C21C666|nr:S9 family peptidase [Aquihabitans sp. G128]QXC61200.1 S9 family peptidase [Aquihabitans sp. G128]
MPDADPTSLPPRPARRPEARTHHGITVDDPYAWLRDAEDPETVPHLEAENAWTEAVTADQAELREQLFQEIKGRTQEDDRSVPVRDGAWWYHQRTEEGSSYAIHCRRADDGTGTAPVEGEGTEQVVLDPNQLAGEGEYLGLGVLDVSPDGDWLAYAVDREGDERHQLRFRDLRTGIEASETVPDVAYGFAWAADSTTCWYTVQDEASRPHRVLRHVVGTDPSLDDEVFREDDERFHLHVAPSRSGRVAVISAGSAITSESWLLDATEPESAPQLVAEREQGVEYSVAHHPSGLLVVSNHDGAEDFALWRAPLTGITVAPRSEWEALLPHRPGTRIAGVEAFAGHAIVHGRTDGLTALWLLDPATGEARPFPTDEAVGTIGPGANATFDTGTYRFSYSSMTTPPSVVDEDLATGERTVRKQLPVLGDFDAARYRSEREWATAEDGTRVPISLVWRPDALVDGEPAPCVLYGYGAYEASMDPWFSVARLSLLDRGVVFAIAHVRGGGELGRGWYEHGKFGEKANTFTDFVAAARHLVATGRTAPDRLAARGGSAGGLLMGAIANLAPELFRAVVAEVPFVDPLTTMLDPTLPLTVIEWEEWGDPLHDAEAYGWLAGYSPYENAVADVAYPAILATTGLNDPRVGYHEPAKWVARLRDLGHGAGPADDDRPVLLKVELGAGHGGPTGRYDAWRDEAFTLAFILTAIGATRPLP